MKKLLFVLGLAVLFSGCNPSELEVEIYTSDLVAVTEGEIIQVPARIEFTFPSSDKEELLKLAKEKAMEFLPKNAAIEITKGVIGKKLTITTKFPMGVKSTLVEDHKKNPALVNIVVEADKVFLLPTERLEKLNEVLRDLHFVLNVKFPSNTTIFRVISDTRERFAISGTAVFLNNKAHLHYREELDRRDSVAVEFEGRDGSVYREINPFVIFARLDERK